jgi:hypothetical protein
VKSRSGRRRSSSKSLTNPEKSGPPFRVTFFSPPDG